MKEEAWSSWVHHESFLGELRTDVGPGSEEGTHRSPVLCPLLRHLGQTGTRNWKNRPTQVGFPSSVLGVSWSTKVLDSGSIRKSSPSSLITPGLGYSEKVGDGVKTSGTLSKELSLMRLVVGQESIWNVVTLTELVSPLPE